MGTFVVLGVMFVALRIALPLAGAVLHLVIGGGGAAGGGGEGALGELARRDRLRDDGRGEGGAQRVRARLLVLPVANTYWQMAVLRVAAVSTVVLVDISGASEQPDSGAGDADGPRRARHACWWSTSRTPAGSMLPWADQRRCGRGSLAAVLEGRQVLALHDGRRVAPEVCARAGGGVLARVLGRGWQRAYEVDIDATTATLFTRICVQQEVIDITNVAAEEASL